MNMPGAGDEHDVFDISAGRRLESQVSNASLSPELSWTPSNLSGYAPPTASISRKKGTIGRLKNLGRNLRKSRQTVDPAAVGGITVSAAPSIKGSLRSKWRHDVNTPPGQLIGAGPSGDQSRVGAGGKGSGGNGSSSNRELLAQIERGTYVLEAEIGRLNEKGIVGLRGDLAALEHECAQELRRFIVANYRPYIIASQSIIQLEGETQQVRAHLSSFGNMVRALKGAAASHPSRLAEEAAQEVADLEVPPEWRDSLDGRRWASQLTDIDVAIAELRWLDALQSIQSLPDSIALPTASDAGSDGREEVDSRRRQLVAAVEEAVAEPSASPLESRLAVGVLAAVTGRPRAVRVLLAAHSARLKRAQQQLLKPQNTGSGEVDGTEFTGAMAQKLCSAVATAADDVAAVFGEDAPDLTALFMVWALGETDRATLLLKRHALTPFAVPAGLTATVKCALLMRAQALALQASHGISLAPRLTRELWPVVDAVLQRRLRRASDDARKTLVAEADRIAKQGVPRGATKTVWGRLMDSWQSADDLLDEVSFCVNSLAPLGGPRVAAALRKGVAELYGSYTSGMAVAFLKYKDPDGHFPPLLDPAVEEAMETVTMLHERFLPEAVATLEYLGPLCAFATLLPHTKALAEALGCSLG